MTWCFVRISVLYGLMLSIGFACSEDPGKDGSDGQDRESTLTCPALDTYELKQEIVLADIPAEASGITWNRDSNSFFVVANLQGSMWEYDENFETLLRTITLEDVDTDTEGVAYLEDGWVAISAENNVIYAADVSEGVTRISGSDTGQVQIYQPSDAPPVTNAGLEGIAYQRSNNGSAGHIFTCQEHLPMRVLQFEYRRDLPPFAKKSALDGTLDVEEPWDAEQLLSEYVTDVSGMTYDETNDTLLIVSQESSSVIRVNPKTGAVTETLSLEDTTTSEGITLFDACQLAIVSEPNRVQIYSPKRS
jgi:uncharacterized protein YjiK